MRVEGAVGQAGEAEALLPLAVGAKRCTGQPTALTRPAAFIPKWSSPLLDMMVDERVSTYVLPPSEPDEAK